MGRDYFSNAFETTLASGIDDSVTIVDVTSIDGIPSGVPFRARIVAEGANTNEIITVTSGAGSDQWQIVRASEAYAGVQTPSAHSAGAKVEHVLTAGSLSIVADGFLPYYDPDRPPNTGLLYSDEFNNPVLDSGWSWDSTPSGPVSVTNFPGYLHMEDGTNSAANTRYLTRDFTPGAIDFSIAAKVHKQSQNGNFSGLVGVGVRSASADIFVMSLANDGTTTASDSHRILNTAGATWGAIAPGLPDLAPVYLLVTRTSADFYSAWFSTNGITWHLLGTLTNAITVQKIAILWGDDTDSNHAEAMVDWVRVYNSITRRVGSAPY